MMALVYIPINSIKGACQPCGDTPHQPLWIAARHGLPAALGRGLFVSFGPENIYFEAVPVPERATHKSSGCCFCAQLYHTGINQILYEFVFTKGLESVRVYYPNLYVDVMFRAAMLLYSTDQYAF